MEREVGTFGFLNSGHLTKLRDKTGKLMKLLAKKVLNQGMQKNIALQKWCRLERRGGSLPSMILHFLV
ncbi:MAG: hypothetical protein AB8B62_13990 [Roseobacter sp.]